MTWFDAHLDLACIAVNGRDMDAELEEISGARPRKSVGPWPPAAVTLPSLRAGGVRRVLATIFTETNGDGPEGYPAGDADAAHEAGMKQIRVYHNWVHDAGVHLTDFSEGAERLGDDHGPAPHAGTGAGAYASPTQMRPGAVINMGVLIENADPIRDPEELAWWVGHGVIAVGMAWWTPSRYAGGNGTDTGLTELGRELVKAMDDLRVLHDVSHLSQKSTDELFAATDRLVCASHSNCRALLGGEANESWQRHLSDASIAEIARRGGVVGLNLCRNFLHWFEGATPETLGRPSIEQTIAHVEHVCEIAGHTRAVGLGSDMDGGFSADDLPEGVNWPPDLLKLTTALTERGWSEEEIAGFQRENWLRAIRNRGAKAEA